jgi:outer membrane protein OmpA-like peptidoglycan-associated protein
MYIKIILYSLIMVFITSCNDNTTDPQLIAYNNKAVKLEQAGNYSEALKYYEKARNIDPENWIVWLGIGDVYYKQKQLPLSFEAYLHACKGEEKALQRVKELYKGDLYKTIDDQTTFNDESLSLLLNAERMKKIDQMVKECLNTKATIIISEVKPEIIFRNIHFETGKSTLKDKQAIKWLEKLVAIWNQSGQKNMILIKGHTDSQQYPNDRKNWELSVNRAFTVSDTLIELKVPRTCIGIAGYGYSIPAKGSQIEEFDKNRRVEIEILSQKCSI